MKAACASCGKPLPEVAELQRFRPFCSERCKMGDLGAWFAERYSVPAETSEDAEDAPEITDVPPRRQ